MTTISMAHYSTGEEIEVELSDTSHLTRQVIREYEFLGYRFVNLIEALRIIRSIDVEEENE
tara:strand:+ start:467 stop:649 length:183 start_codon:yes stop_codon:yes gene_type:complete